MMVFICCLTNQLRKTSDNATNTYQPTTRGEEFDHPDTVKLTNQSTVTSNQLIVTSHSSPKPITTYEPHTYQ